MKMTIPFIDLKTQYLDLKPQIHARIDAVLQHGQYIMGPEVKELEDRLSAFTGATHCITCASGTEALLMSLMALGIGAGDEVITTPFTFVATAEVIVLLGATPIFVDVEPETGNMNARLVASAITSKTKAIIPVSLYGQTADMDVIVSVAAAHGDIPVIEDAAQSFGAIFRGQKSCNLSTIGCTSFFPSKPLGCYGDGGAVFTNDHNLAEAMREIRVHGQKQRYIHTRIGVGGRMDTLQAAVLLAKLERFPWELARRQENGALYNRIFDDFKVDRIQQRIDRTSVHAQYTLVVEERDRVKKSLEELGIPTAVHYPVPINQQPAYAHLCCPDCTPIAKKLSEKVLSIPMGPDLTNDEIHKIADAVVTSK